MKSWHGLFIVIGALALAAGCRPAANTSDYSGPSAVIEVTSDNHFKTLLEENDVVVVDFWASWCYPCQILKPTLAEISNDYQGRAVVLSVDVDEHSEIASRYRIESIPSVFIFKNGESVKNLIGALPREDYTAVLDKLVTASPDTTTDSGS